MRLYSAAKPTPAPGPAHTHEHPYQYGFAREALWALAATETYGLHVALDPLRASEHAPRRMYRTKLWVALRIRTIGLRPARGTVSK